MTTSAASDHGYTIDAYFDLVRAGAIEEGDHVELLEGLVVASPPQGPLHAGVLTALYENLREAIGQRASIRVQMPLLLGSRSAPEPDVAVVAGEAFDYLTRHPEAALLVAEVSDSSLPQDRLTKSRIYASAGVPEYWIVNLREACLEVSTKPDRERRVYTETRRVPREATVELVALPGATLTLARVLPAY